LTTYVSQGSAATDSKGGGSFKSTFLRRFFLNLTVKRNYEKWSTFADVLPFGARGSGNYGSPCTFDGVSCIQQMERLCYQSSGHR